VRGTVETSGASVRSGALAAVGCYLLWGLVPLYWKRLAAIDSLELIAHRHLWSLALLGLLMVGRGEGWRSAIDALSTLRGAARLMLASLLLTTNWLVYVWGVNTGHIVETSLGYFLVPLFSVLAGRFLLHEQLRRVPWIALALAGGWSSYSVLRKQSALGAIPGLAVETLLLAPAALGFLTDALKSARSFPANGARVWPNLNDEVGGRGLLGLTSHAPSLLLGMDWVSRPQLRFGWVTNVLTNCIPG
jgi:chloramphenicol-sensitive protein RarD